MLIQGDIQAQINEWFGESVNAVNFDSEVGWSSWLSLDGRGFCINFFVTTNSPIVGQALGVSAYIPDPQRLTQDAIANVAQEMLNNLYQTRSEVIENTLSTGDNPPAADGLILPS